MKRTLLLALPAALIAACGGSPSGADNGTPDVRIEATPVGTDDTGLLPGNHWLLASATTADGSTIDALFPGDGHTLRLDFNDGRVSVSGGCNGAGGGYEHGNGTLTIGQMASTQMACAEPLMAMDATAGALLTGTLDVEALDAGQLRLTTTAGDTLVFRGEPTAEARYGGEGNTVFMEVAAQRVPCSHAMIPDYQCLHVREVVYDDNGLKQSEGEWQFLYQDIEGYTHEPGVRNVLRLKRFDIANPPADASSIAYVLDMVVESELATP